MKNVYCLIAIIGLCMIFTTSLAFGQDLGGKWFQVTYSAKGYLGGDNYLVGSGFSQNG